MFVVLPDRTVAAYILTMPFATVVTSLIVYLFPVLLRELGDDIFGFIMRIARFG